MGGQKECSNRGGGSTKGAGVRGIISNSVNKQNKGKPKRKFGKRDRSAPNMSLYQQIPILHVTYAEHKISQTHQHEPQTFLCLTGKFVFWFYIKTHTDTVRDIHTDMVRN